GPIQPVTVDEDAAVTEIDLSAHFTDVESSTLTYTIVSNTNDTLVATVIDDATLTLAFRPNESGSATLVVRASDGDGESVEQSIAVTVNAVNDAPTVVAPIEPVTVDEDAADTEIDLSAHFTDIESSTLTYTIVANTNDTLVSTAIDGSMLTLGFAPNESGSATLIVRASDGSESVEQSIAVTVNAVNNAPTVVAPIQPVTVDEDAADTEIDLSAHFTDVESSTLTYTIVGNTNDTLVATAIDDAMLTLAFTPNESGFAALIVRASDGSDSVEQSIAVTVNAVNDAPTVVAPIEPVTVDEDAADTEIDLSAHFTDVESATLTYTIVGNTNDTLVSTAIDGATLTLAFTPNGSGLATLVVRASDGSDSVEQSIAVTVNAVNDAPTIVTPIEPVTVDEDAADTEIDLSAHFTDVESSTLTYTVVGNTNDTLVSTAIDGATLTLAFTPNGSGSATLIVRASDDGGESVEQSIAVTVNAVNNAPTVVAPIDPVTVDENAADTEIDLSAHFADVEPGTLTYTVEGNTNDALVATAIDASTLTLAYLPDQSGTATLVVRATDAGGLFAEATIAVTVIEVAGEDVTLDGKILTIHGTSGDDQLELILGDTYGVAINGNEYQFAAQQVDTILFDGGAGNDQVILFGSPANETVDLYPNSATFFRQGLDVSLSGTDDVTVFGEGGNDTLSLFGSAGNDNFVGSPTYAAMYGDGFYNRGWNFGSVQAWAGDGVDVAKFFDSPGDDTYVGAPIYNAVSGEGFNNVAWYFEGAHAYATAGGVDVAKFYDSTADDTYVASPTYAALFNPNFEQDGMNGFYNRAKFFEGVHAYATAGGVDVARFYDSPADDAFVATPTYAALFNMDYQEQYTNGFYNRAKFFEATHAFATAGGIDEARLYDSTQDDTFFADATHGALFNPTYQQEYTNGFYNRAKYFEGVHAFATAGGYDRAEMHDSPADDIFDAAPTQAALFNPTYQEEYTSGFYNRAKYFEEVNAVADRGGVDAAILHDSTGDDVFTAYPLYADMVNPAFQQSYTRNGFDNRAEEFESVHAIGGNGGNDEANLFDSALADYLEVQDNWARLSSDELDFDNLVENFGMVRATSSSTPGDKKRVADVYDFVLELDGIWEDE
ncbi:MAG: tandem-95 repeat protein, partial [Thermoguttaceae bacterium]